MWVETCGWVECGAALLTQKQRSTGVCTVSKWEVWGGRFALLHFCFHILFRFYECLVLSFIVSHSGAFWGRTNSVLVVLNRKLAVDLNGAKISPYTFIG